MTLHRASKQELKDVAQDLFGMIVADLRDEIADLREEVNRLQESVIALNTQQVALANRTRTELARSEKSREAILKRLAEVENAARAVS